MTELFDDLGIDVEPSDMSLCVSLDEKQGCEWGSRNGLRGLFAQINNAVKPKFWRMLQEINKFKTDVIMYLEGLENNSEMDCTETLGQFFESRTYSEFFQKAYLFPIGTSIWSCPSETVMELSAYSILSFCRDHHLLQLSDGPLWLAVKGSSQRFVNKIRTELEARGNQIRTSCEVNFVSKSDKGCTLFCVDGSEDLYDECIIAVPASDTIKILGKEVIDDEMRILRAFQHVYWPHVSLVIFKEKEEFGSAEHVMAGLSAANAVLRSFAPLARPKQMVFSSKAAAARRYTTNFLKRFISAGCLILLEDGGTVLKFEGSDKGCTWKTTIRVHTPRFYWKVAIEADFGLADAFINKDISVVDSNEGLLNLFRARVEEQDEVLEIGCGWGTLAIELVKKTGCRYTGITLAEEQLKYAEQKVKEAGLQFPSLSDTILSEVIEQVGDEYYEDFFRHCDSLLADNGLFVLQTISIPDERYDEHKRSSEGIYFPWWIATIFEPIDISNEFCF
ncbi:Sphingolipid C9-methyltransferase [Bienertia sinuspersici]